VDFLRNSCKEKRVCVECVDSDVVFELLARPELTTLFIVGEQVPMPLLDADGLVLAGRVVPAATVELRQCATAPFQGKCRDTFSMRTCTNGVVLCWMRPS
jgi:hypothetical protein